MNGAGPRVQAGLLASEPPPDGGPGGTLLVTDRNVEAILPPAWQAPARHVIAPGEGSKSWDGLGRLLEALDAARLDRDGLVLAVGGGVVTDLAGLAASLHRRGTAWVAVPTSLVGQVDAAVGGKTAVNLGGGKNTVGSFHEPREVLVDPAVLASLPRRHLAAGLAEVLKTALIAGESATAAALEADPTAFAAGAPAAEALIRTCLETKLALVREDLRDTGRRRLLNLGHTFGHAFEALALGELLHGEAVALGLVCAARLGGAGELEARLVATLEGWGLPVRGAAPRQALLDQMGRDKKRSGGGLTAVALEGPGRVVLRPDVGIAELERALEAVAGD